MASAGPRELHLTVPRTARYWTLGEPGPGLRQVWIACHGYGQLAARQRRAPRGRPRGALALLP